MTDTLQTIIHYSNHFIVPLVFARLLYKENWLKVSLLLWATMLIDLDHLLATPIFKADRCSVGYHPLHSYYIIPFYIILCYFKKYRVIGIGLLWHIVTDAIDCWLMNR